MRSRQPTAAATARLPCVSRAWTPCCADSAVSVALAGHRRLPHSPGDMATLPPSGHSRRWVTAGVGVLPVTAVHGRHGPRTVRPGRRCRPSAADSIVGAASVSWPACEHGRHRPLPALASSPVTAGHGHHSPRNSAAVPPRRPSAADTTAPVPCRPGRRRCVGRPSTAAGVGILPVSAGHGQPWPRTSAGLLSWLSIGGCRHSLGVMASRPASDHGWHSAAADCAARPGVSRTWMSRSADSAAPVAPAVAGTIGG